MAHLSQAFSSISAPGIHTRFGPGIDGSGAAAAEWGRVGVVFGLLAALFWGLGDYLVTVLTRHVGTARALVYIQAISLAMWLLLLSLYGVPNPDGRMWLSIAACGVFHVLGLVFTYRAFEIGTLSIVSPIASGFAVVTGLIAIIAGERPELGKLIGAVLLVIGVILVTQAQGEAGSRSLRGVPHAIASAVAFGVMFWLFDPISREVKFALPLVVLKVMATASSMVSLRAATS